MSRLVKRVGEGSFARNLCMRLENRLYSWMGWNLRQSWGLKHPSDLVVDLIEDLSVLKYLLILSKGLLEQYNPVTIIVKIVYVIWLVDLP